MGGTPVHDIVVVAALVAAEELGVERTGARSLRGGGSERMVMALC